MMIGTAHSILLIFVLIAAFETRKLTEAENQKRLETCGTVHQSKVFRGRKTTREEAPWAVGAGISGVICSATLISSRHVSCATHCIFSHSKTGDYWTTENRFNYTFDRSKCKDHGHVVATETLASKVGVYIDGKLIGRAKFIIFFGLCRYAREEYRKQYADDFMIIEMSEDVEFSPTLHPACVARGPEDNAPDTILDYYGHGDDPSTNSRSGEATRHEKIKVRDDNKKGTVRGINPQMFQTRSVDEKTITCPGDSGGGAMATIDGRVTVVGTLMRTTCVLGKTEEEKLRYRTTEANEVFASVGFHAPYICQFTGICTPPRSASASENECLLLIALFSYLLSNEY